MSIESDVLDKFVNFGYMRKDRQKISADYTIERGSNGVRVLSYGQHWAKLDYAGNLVITRMIKNWGAFNFGALIHNFNFVKKLDGELFLYKRKPTLIINMKAGMFGSQKNGEELPSLICGYKWEDDDVATV